MSDASSNSSFSSTRKWSIMLNLAVTLLALVSLLAMINYLSARHYRRLAWSPEGPARLSPLTLRVLEGVTNRIRATIYFNVDSPLYDSVADLLREYHFANNNVDVDTVDYQREPGAAQLVKTKYELERDLAKDVVIFECNGSRRIISEKEMSELDISPLVSGRSKEVKRTHFKGEMLFTSAILNVTSTRPLRAYFLKDHREHPPESLEADTGYSRFAALLKENNITWETLSLGGTNQIPSDANLLIIAGPQNPYLTGELDKIDQYLAGGGRLLILFDFYGVNRNAGLLYILSKWGVVVGDDVVRDRSKTSNGQDLLVSHYGSHPITRPLIETPLYLVYPRSVKPTSVPPGAEGPTVTELFYTSPAGAISTEIKDGVIPEPPPGQSKTNVCLAVAVEKGKIRDAAADRGTTRIVVVGESFFLNNRMIDYYGNRDFAGLAINWLLDRSELLGGLRPRAITEYKVVVPKGQLSALYWILLLGLPGSVLAAGLAVWTRRRR